MTLRPELYHPARIGIGVLFIIAGLVKVIHALNFSDSIYTYQVIPSYIIDFVALALPPYEVSIGLMLLGNVQIRLAACCATILLVVFIIALLQASIRGLAIDCGCFGSSSPAIWKNWAFVVRDFALLFISQQLYSHSTQPKTRFKTA